MIERQIELGDRERLEEVLLGGEVHSVFFGGEETIGRQVAT